MAEKKEIDILEVMRHMEIEPRKAYQFLSKLQMKTYTDDEEEIKTEQAKQKKINRNSKARKSGNPLGEK